MKRIFSLMLVVLMLASVLPVAYAAKTCPACGGSNFRAYEHDCEVDMDCLDCGYCPGCSDYFWSDEDNDEVSTIVLYTGRAEEYYEVRVPAIMAPGTSRQVQIHGTWPSNRQLNVTVDPTVTMVNGLNPANTKTLNITMDNIALPGSDIDDDGPYYRDFNISVSNLSGVLFGTWTGEFNYNVGMVNIGPALISFTVNEPGYTKIYQAEEGMTWAEWVASDYCTGNYCVDCDSYADSLHGGDFWIGSDDYGTEATDTIVADAVYNTSEW